MLASLPDGEPELARTIGGAASTWLERHAQSLVGSLGRLARQRERWDMRKERRPVNIDGVAAGRLHDRDAGLRAIDRGLRLNEYGLFRSTEETRDPALRVPCRTEEEIYAALDLGFVGAGKEEPAFLAVLAWVMGP